MIFFRKKVHRLVNPEETDRRLQEEGLHLEKDDKKAIILASLVVFGPIVLGAAVVLGLLAFWLLR